MGPETGVQVGSRAHSTPLPPLAGVIQFMPSCFLWGTACQERAWFQGRKEERWKGRFFQSCGYACQCQRLPPPEEFEVPRRLESSLQSWRQGLSSLDMAPSAVPSAGQGSFHSLPATLGGRVLLCSKAPSSRSLLVDLEAWALVATTGCSR